MVHSCINRKSSDLKWYEDMTIIIIYICQWAKATEIHTFHIFTVLGEKTTNELVHKIIFYHSRTK